MLNNKAENIQERCYTFALSIILATRNFPRNSEGFVLSSQMVKAASSIPANLFEGSGGVSKKEFIQFISLARKSAIEMMFWIRLVSDLCLISKDQHVKMLDEYDQIVRILSKIILNSKK